MREYKSFKELDRDLKLLKLQQEIDKEKVLLSYNQTRESLAPKQMLRSVAGSIFKNALVLRGATKVLGFIGDKLR